MTNFILRSLTSIFLVPFFLYFIYLNNFFLYTTLLIIFFISLYEVKFFYPQKLYWLIFISLLVIASLISLIFLRGETNESFYYLVWIITVVWLSDIGGYIFGNIFRGPKISKYSPKKTFSGVFGSFFLSQFAFLIFQVFENSIAYSLFFFFTQLVISSIVICGDLFFSYIKRINNIKDFSNIIPGHGGLLDRIDGLIFVLIFASFLKILNVY